MPHRRYILRSSFNDVSAKLTEPYGTAPLRPYAIAIQIPAAWILLQ